MKRGAAAIVDESFCFRDETYLTVHKTSMFFPGDGFSAYCPDGHLLFRFDSYGPISHLKGDLVLMDPSGKCLLTLSRKMPSLHQRWEGFLGERRGDEGPIFSVYKSSIIGPSNAVVQVYGDPGAEYRIMGYFSRRCCTIYNSAIGEEPVAEIKRKVDPTTNVMLGKDVFWLCLKPGLDGAFAMGLVLVLDQMYGDDDSDTVDAALQNSSPSPKRVE